MNLLKTVGTVTRKIARSTQKQSPKILTWLGISGMITTTVIAVKVTPEVMWRIEEKKAAENADHLTPLQTIEAAGKCYIPALVTGAASVACLIGAESVSGRRNAALATAYSLVENSFLEYRDKVAEEVGEKKEAEIHKQVWKERAEKDLPNVRIDPAIVDSSLQILCCDIMFNQYFYSNRNEIERVINNINRRMSYGCEPYVSLNELYGDLGHDDIPIGNQVGWNVARGFINVRFDSVLLNGTTPCLGFDYVIPPVYDYEYLN